MRSSLPTLLLVASFLGGLGLIVFGVFLFSPAAAAIVAGVFCVGSAARYVRSERAQPEGE